jgi:hypothetical protein
MEFLKRYWTNALIWAILVGMLIVRLTSYGELFLSVANYDTETYIKAGRAPLFSRDMLTRNRLFTTNLLYYLADTQNCKIELVSYPAAQMETYRGIQPCFNGIIFFQNMLSVIAWSTLALVVSKRLKGIYEKLLAVILITAFGFTPSIADWDSILSSESLTFSLFALSAALALEFGFRTIKNSNDGKFTVFINVLTIMTLTLYAFTRDANIYTLLVLLITAVATILVAPTLRKNKKILISIATLFLIVAVGLQSAMYSRRWEKPIANVFNDLILPHPARVEFMQTLGMPDPDSAAYQKWFIENAPRAYVRFLLFHPGYTLTTFTNELDGIFSENIQPYFYSEQTPARLALISINDLLHPKTHLVFILDFILMTGIFVATFRRKNKNYVGWLWFTTWLFVSASLTLAVGFFADAIGIIRHTMFAVETFRLMFLLFLLILLDQANRTDDETSGHV